MSLRDRMDNGPPYLQAEWDDLADEVAALEERAEKMEKILRAIIHPTFGLEYDSAAIADARVLLAETEPQEAR